MTRITALNGRLPADQLVVVDTGAYGPQRLSVFVAPIWAAMLAAGMPAGCLTSGYRTIAEQNALVAAGETIARGGTSEHGEGLAADIAPPARAWVHENAAAWGLKFTVAGEEWHTYLGQAHIPAGHTTSTTLEEDTMLQLARLKNSPDVYVGDGITRRHVASPTELADLQYKLTTGALHGDPTVQVVDRIDWLGKPL